MFFRIQSDAGQASWPAQEFVEKMIDFITLSSHHWDLIGCREAMLVNPGLKFPWQARFVHNHQSHKNYTRKKKKHPLICCKHFPAAFLCPKVSCWLSCAAFRDEKAISSSTGLWNGLRFKSVFGKCKEPLGKSWDRKHHNWSGHSVIETGIQMSCVNMQNQFTESPSFLSSCVLKLCPSLLANSDNHLASVPLC